MSTAIAAVPDSPFIVAPERNGKEIELARSTVYLEFSIHALGDKRKVPAKDMEVGEADKTLITDRITLEVFLEPNHKR
jgi:hypothetical protein